MNEMYNIEQIAPATADMRPRSGTPRSCPFHVLKDGSYFPAAPPAAEQPKNIQERMNIKIKNYKNRRSHLQQ
jgi:hypothetical protein